MTLYTIGHSTHSEAEFIWLLKQHGVDHLIDVRSMPGSRKFPHRPPHLSCVSTRGDAKEGCPLV